MGRVRGPLRESRRAAGSVTETNLRLPDISVHIVRSPAYLPTYLPTYLMHIELHADLSGGAEGILVGGLPMYLSI